MKCLQCNSERIVQNVRAADHASNNMLDLSLVVYENPEAWILKGEHKCILKGNVCVECGFVMFSVSLDDAQILETYQD